MKDYMDYIRLAVIGIIGVFAVYGVGHLFFSTSGSGVHPIGANAVYIAGEACTINAGLDRSEEDIIRDAKMCVNYHTVYMGLAEYDKKGHAVVSAVSGK